VAGTGIALPRTRRVCFPCITRIDEKLCTYSFGWGFVVPVDGRCPRSSAEYGGFSGPETGAAQTSPTTVRGGATDPAAQAASAGNTGARSGPRGTSGQAAYAAAAATPACADTAAGEGSGVRHGSGFDDGRPAKRDERLGEA
jgi:hypothetical protein